MTLLGFVRDGGFNVYAGRRASSGCPMASDESGDRLLPARARAVTPDDTGDVRRLRHPPPPAEWPPSSPRPPTCVPGPACSAAPARCFA